MRKLFTFIVVCSASTASLLGQAGQGSPAPGSAGKNDPKSRSLSGEARPGPRPPTRWWTSEKNRQELKLTAEQLAQLDKIYVASMDRMKAQKDDFDRLQSDFSQLLRTSTASERDLLRAADSLELARFKVSSERTSMLVRLHSVLTPEQRLGLQAIFKRNDDERNKNNNNRSR